jgi:N-acetylneuraminate lyase
VHLIKTLIGYGYMGAAKTVMAFLGVDVGPARLPNTNLNAAQRAALHADLESLGFFDWLI